MEIAFLVFGKRWKGLLRFFAPKTALPMNKGNLCGLRFGGLDGETEPGGHLAQAIFGLLAAALFVARQAFLGVLEAASHRCVKELGEFARHGHDGHRLVSPAFDAPVKLAQRQNLP